VRVSDCANDTRVLNCCASVGEPSGQLLTSTGLHFVFPEEPACSIIVELSFLSLYFMLSYPVLLYITFGILHVDPSLAN
jgi:hypothetical protein